MRKHTLEYDDVLNQQREVIYNYRDEILEGRDMGDVARQEIVNLIERLVTEYMASDFVEDWDVQGLLTRMTELFQPSDELLSRDPDRLDREELTTRLQEEALALYAQREVELGEFDDGLLMRALERYLLLQIIDQRWREHLHDMDYLREGIHLRGLAQLDPLVAYKNEAFTLFGDLMNLIWLDFGRMIYHVQVTVQEMPPPGYTDAPTPIPATSPSPTSSSSTGGGQVRYTGGAALMGSQALAAAAAGGAAGLAEPEHAAGAPNGAAPVVQQRHADANEPGRNDPCWCGSGKKYKKCHGA